MEPGIIVANTVLHVGAGSSRLPPWIETEHETRFDIESRNKPDIVGDMRCMGDIGQFDVVFSCHVLEHVTLSDARIVLAEFKRVLTPKGLCVLIVPDLEDIRPNEDVVYVSPAGPVCGLDIYYGMQSLVGMYPHMGHKYGYTQANLHRELVGAGFSNVMTRRVDGWNLVGYGVRA